MRTRFCLLLVIALTGSPLLADSLGGLTVSGKVWTNQVALPSGSSVYAGDRIQTDASGVAVLGIGTHRLEIRPDSSVTLRGDSLDLHRGVVGSSGHDIVLGDTAVSAGGANNEAWFVVSETDGQVLVAAYRGDALIRDRDGRRTMVPAGSFAMAAAAPQGTQPPKDSTTKGTTSRGAESAATKGKWSVGKLSATKLALIATAGAAAATAGVVSSGDDLRDESVSP
ncbi:MAG: hypothetical protein O3A53_04475 [Acidobacteria bacterium]|nr:hypothetical protein [Acidobacteriota bacterium]MDA1234036.1 hypothetical protein [Acidobacteriota bacterium]